jgi:hypothetical protein
MGFFITPRDKMHQQRIVTLMKEVPGSSETSVLTRATRHNNPGDTILHSHRHENLKSYIETPQFSLLKKLKILRWSLKIMAPLF